MEAGDERAPRSLRALVRGSALITLANVVPRAGAFLLLPLYTNFLTTADFGTVSLAASGALLLATVARLGLDASLLRMHADSDGAERGSLYASLAGVTMASVVVLSACAIGVVLLAADGEAGLLVPATLLALAIGGANAFHFIPSVWFRGQGRMGRYLVLALAAFGATVAVTVAAVVFLRLGAIGTLLGQLAGALIVALSALVVLWRLRPWHYRPALARRALAFGLPLLPQSAAGWLLNVSDRWLLALLLGMTAANTLAAIGVYSLGYQLGYAVGMVAVSVNAAWLPFLYRLADAPGVAVVVREGTTLVVSGFVALATALAILAPDLVAIIAPPEWAGAADVTAIVAFASAANAAGLMFASGLLLVRTTGAIPFISIASGAVNLTCNVILIPSIGVIGAAWATLAAYVAFAALTAVAASRRYPAAVDVQAIATVVAAGVSFTLLSRLSTAAGWHVALAALAVAATWLLTRRAFGMLRTTMAGAGGRRGEVG